MNGLKQRGRTNPADRDKFGPKRSEHRSVGKPCAACQMKFKAGNYTTLIALGPGDSKEQRERARAGRAFDAVAVEVHWVCATGQQMRPVAAS